MLHNEPVSSAAIPEAGMVGQKQWRGERHPGRTCDTESRGGDGLADVCFGGAGVVSVVRR